MQPLPRSVHFARNIALGALVATATAYAAGCASTVPVDAPATDTPMASADVPTDAGVDARDSSAIDGPLHPPDLPRRVRA
jgi:hypothetical protein